MEEENRHSGPGWIFFGTVIAFLLVLGLACTAMYSRWERQRQEDYVAAAEARLRAQQQAQEAQRKAAEEAKQREAQPPPK